MNTNTTPQTAEQINGAQCGSIALSPSEKMAARILRELDQETARLKSRVEKLEGGGAGLIAAERRRQIEKEGWTPKHDDAHTRGELAAAAACYAMQSVLASKIDGTQRYKLMPPSDAWPWDDEWWKPKNRVRDLIRAGALIAAEIDRLQRANQKDSQ